MRALRHVPIVGFACLCACETEPPVPLVETTGVSSAPLQIEVEDTSGALIRARSDHVMVLLEDVNVLACGGTSDGTTALAECERYDPANGLWRPAASMAQPRRAASAVLLRDGSVLVCGGGHVTCERYDPASDVWDSAPSMASSRTRGTLTRLTSGKVLAVGGDAGGVAEVFDR